MPHPWLIRAAHHDTLAGLGLRGARIQPEGVRGLHPRPIAKYATRMKNLSEKHCPTSTIAIFTNYNMQTKSTLIILITITIVHYNRHQSSQHWWEQHATMCSHKHIPCELEFSISQLIIDWGSGWATTPPTAEDTSLIGPAGGSGLTGGSGGGGAVPGGCG